MLIKLQADVQGLKTGLAQAENAIKGVDKSVQTASNGMTNFVSKLKQVGATMGIAFAGTQILQFGRDVIAQAMEAEAQQQRLYQLMKVGTGATDEQIAALNAQADALEKVGVVTGGNITQTQSQLATFNLQYDTIQRLTPAILDYVTAEKGANASADEFKQMTNGLAQALNGNFGSLTRVGFVLDDHTKKLISSGTEAERSAAIVDVLNSTYKGFNEELRNTPAGQMQALRNDFDKLKEDLGKKLLPALLAVTGFFTDTLIPAFRKLEKFVEDNGDAIKIYAGIIVFATGVFYAYKAAIVATTTVTTVYTAVTKSMAAGNTLAAIATLNLRGAIMMLNMAMRANPIGVLITALTVLGAAFIAAWKKSETFRSVVISGAQGVMYAFSGIVGALGKVLGVIGKIPGMGWAKGLSKGAEDFANKINIAGKNLADLKKKATGYGEGAFTYGSGGLTGGGGDTGGGLDSKEKKKLEGYKKDVTKIYKDMNEAIADAQEKAAEILEARNEKMFETHKKYDERVADLEKDFRERNSKYQKDYDEKVLEINKTFNKRKFDLEKDLQTKLANLRENANKKSADLTQASAEKQTSIIQQSVDRLRKAFATKTGFDISEVFSGGANAEDAIAKLKKTLQAAQELQSNAAKLAGRGYSQVFIEEVVKNGPEAGNSIAKALMEASPEATKELQDLYNKVENVSNNGLDNLAKSMNAGGRLATEELMQAYAEVAVDLKKSLAQVDVELQKSLVEANAAYEEAMTEAKITRDEGLADALKAFTEAKEEAQKNLNEGLAEAQKVLQEALLEAQKDYEKAVDEINKSTMKKLVELQDKLKEVAAAMKAINASSAAGVISNAPVYSPILATPTPGGLSGKTDSASTVTNISQTFNTTRVDPEDVHLAVVSATKYGQAVTLPKNAPISAKVRDM
jgi:hypothetical protein